jgi:hypothetical protein
MTHQVAVVGGTRRRRNAKKQRRRNMVTGLYQYMLLAYEERCPWLQSRARHHLARLGYSVRAAARVAAESR